MGQQTIIIKNRSLYIYLEYVIKGHIATHTILF